MAEHGTGLSPIKWLGLVITIIVLTNVASLLDISILRQVSSFIFLTFVPGFLILLVLKLNRLGLLEKIVLSLGLSVAFSMLFGLAVNASLAALGYTKPLSTIPLLISFSAATIVLAVVAYTRNKNFTLSFTNPKLTTRELMFLVMPSLFPLLAIVGMHIMNLTDNNLLLMALLFWIPAYAVFISFYHSKVPQRLYPGLIYLIGISLLLILSLRSVHILGSDMHDWYYTFQVTLDNSHWSILGPSIMDACLSISLLPSIYQMFLNINPEYLFKLLYPLLFSISPLVVYIISKKYIGSFYAFLASFFFMAQTTFLWTTGISNTNMAILFFGLAIMALFHDGIGGINRRLLFTIFTTSCVVSHYSTTYVFFFILLLTLIGTQITSRVLPYKRRAATSSDNTIPGGAPSNSSSEGVMPGSDADTSKSAGPSVPRSQFKRVTITSVVLFFTILFFWYNQITLAAFNVGVGFIRTTFRNLGQWFVLESRGSTVTAALGEAINTIPQQIRLVVSWLTVLFVVIGVLITVARYAREATTPKSGRIKPNFLYQEFEEEYLTLALACGAALAFSIVMPYVSVGYSTERIYFQILMVLSVFFVIGSITAAKWLRARPHWIILMALIPFFMCTTGTMYQIFGVPASMALNSSGREYEQWYIHDQEIYAAKWIKEYAEEGITIHTNGRLPQRMLASQGKIPHYQTSLYLIPHYEEGREIYGYIYLRYSDITVHRILTQYPDIFAGKNKIYASNGSEIYR